ncbi:hypothetical protein IJ102_00065 [Candidatus Saccharibacteria bacterium]|nr:hypothetical protein [Candidatus Saccharibacteria bacterium]
MPQKQKNRKTTKKPVAKNRGLSGWKLILAVLMVALLTFGVLSLVKYLSDEKRQIDDQKDKNTATLYEETTPADDETESGNNDRKDEAEADADSRPENQTNTNGKTVAEVMVSSAGVLNDKVLASGMVTNIIETQGDCIYVFRKGSESVTTTTPALQNAKNTVCSSATLDKAKFSAGTWEVTLEYQSNTAEGVSETTTFEVR